LAGAGLQTGLFPSRVFADDAASMSIVKYASSPTEPDGVDEEAERLTRAAVDAIGGMAKYIAKGDVVFVKPNIGWDLRPEQAGNTNPAVVATLVKMCFEAGAKEVKVSDNTCNKEVRTFANSRIQEYAEKAGAKVFFLDKRKYKMMALNGKVLKEWEINEEIREADKLINVPIVKHHRLCHVTLGMKNLMGVIGGNRGKYHQDIDNTVPDLAAFMKPTLVVIDAIRVMTANGPHSGNPADVERRDTLAAGTDQVACDAFAATLLGHQPQDIGHIKEAHERGLGVMDYASLSPKMITV
jgi:uncharacterized protein (DUF362 family)